METTLTVEPTTTTTTPTTITPTLAVSSPFYPKPTQPILTKVPILLAATALPQVSSVVLLATAASLFAHLF